jgi:phage I-like protein
MKRVITAILSSGAFAMALQRWNRAISSESLRLSNEKVEGVSNSVEEAFGDRMSNVEAGALSGWVQVSPYGQFPHPLGLQQLDQESGNAMAGEFNSVLGKLKRGFGGRPWYRGHPDTNPTKYPDGEAYGWINGVEARNDGVYANVDWTPKGEQLIRDRSYKYFSPVWDAAPANVGGKRVVRPYKLVSVGFTNMPNIPVAGLGNEEISTESEAEQAEAQQQQEEQMILPNSILKTLGFADDAKPTEEEIVTAWEKHTQEVDALRTTAEANTTAANELPTLQTALENEKKSVKNLSDQLAETATAFDTERSERIELIVSSAIANGRITKADAEKWKTELKEDFAGKSVELANVKPALANEVLTKDLGKQQAAVESGATPRETARALANEKVKGGKRFEVAWQEVKRERPDLFQGMKQPVART